MRKIVYKDVYCGVEYNPFNGLYEDFYTQEECVVDVAPPIHKREVYYSDKKAIISGDVVEVIAYEKGSFFGMECKSPGKRKSVNSKIDYNIQRTKKRLRRLINANVTGNDLFVTLTYADNMQDVVQAKNDFKRFIERLKRKGYVMKYVYVIEFQKRGAVHFHCIFFDCGFIDSKILAEIWQKGFVKINRINDVDNAGSYVVKYMDKDLVDDRLTGHDLYGRSRCLKEPIEINNPQEVCQLLEDLSENLVYTNTFTNEYKGNCVYCQFNKKRVLNNNNQSE